MNTARNQVNAELITEDVFEAIIANAEGSVAVPFVKSKDRKAPMQNNAALLGEQELLSIYAVLTHIAFARDINQESLLTLIEAEFSVDNIKKIPQSQFHCVMEFLIDLRMDGLRSRR